MYTYLTKKNSKTARMAVIVTTIVSLLLVSTVPVFGQSKLEGSAEINEPDKSPGSGNVSSKGSKEIPPECLQAFLIRRGADDYVRVLNKCGKNMRFKIVITRGGDLDCTNIGRAYTRDYYVHLSPISTFAGLELC